ncbi:hypothetical protein K1719_045218 [Acacia pycnantha]|nr:hypothetical protein K1719_045218 [Acacia pycnantha]
MAEVCISLAAKLTEYLVDPTLRQLQYLFCVGKITKNVEIRKEELIIKQGKIIGKVENLEEEPRANNGCLRGWRPTWSLIDVDISLYYLYFLPSVILRLLEALKIKHFSKLKHVLEGEVGGDAWENVRFPKLKILSVNDCHKSEYVCPVFLAQRFVQLQHLSPINAMKFVFGENFGQEQPMHDQDKPQLVLPLLKYRLENLRTLIGIAQRGIIQVIVINEEK